jgi:hypothetical protein
VAVGAKRAGDARAQATTPRRYQLAPVTVHTPGVPDQPSQGSPGATRARVVRQRAVLGLVALLLALGFLRVHELELDAPNVIVRGYTGQAHYRDEAAKAHEARNKAKWDRWSLSDVDEYEFWRAQSPSWVWGEYAWFRAFGVGLVQARAFVVVHSLVALALLIWLAMVRHGWPAAVAAALLLGLNWSYLVFSRLALMEGALICWLLVATVALAQLDRHPSQAGRWTALATVAMFIACTIKQTGLLLVPAYALMLMFVGLRAGGAFVERPIHGAQLRRALGARPSVTVLVGLASLALALALLISSPEYQQRLAFNAEHFTVAREQPLLVHTAQTLIQGLFGPRLRLMFVRLAPLMLSLALLELVRVAVLEIRRRRGAAELASGPLTEKLGVIDWWMVAWLLLAMLANLASPHRAVRFQLVMLPPAAWLGGALIGRLWLHGYARPRLAQGVRVGLLALALLGASSTIARYARWVAGGQKSAAQIGAQLEALIGDRHAVVVGEFAAQAVFETDYWHFYVRPGQFNSSDEILDALGITHLISAGPDEDFVERMLWRQRSDMLVDRSKLGEVEFRGQTLTVWELSPPS